MRFLADESCDFGVVRALRAAGHDVKAVVEDSPGWSSQVAGLVRVLSLSAFRVALGEFSLRVW